MIVVLVTYDVADDARRQRLFEMLSGRGARVQMSVFECELADTSRCDALIRDIRAMIDDDEDQVRVYRLGSRSDVTVVGHREIEERTAYWIL